MRAVTSAPGCTVSPGLFFVGSMLTKQRDRGWSSARDYKYCAELLWIYTAISVFDTGPHHKVSKKGKCPSNVMLYGHYKVFELNWIEVGYSMVLCIRLKLKEKRMLLWLLLDLFKCLKNEGDSFETEMPPEANWNGEPCASCWNIGCHVSRDEHSWEMLDFFSFFVLSKGTQNHTVWKST